ncbi:RES family NAD+ phosphorylase [Leifsonia sp. NPDC056665]|uniref:RES family NAD+ phosphorylase n=1 Tax=Leifsonia sp. NPDC056665 TaxID=3345901 RepID=UPI00369F5C2F
MHYETFAPLWRPGSIALFRWTPAAAEYAPELPWTSIGRFGDGSFKAIYFAETAKGAVAEFLRRHPEFFSLQDHLRIRLFEVDLNIPGECLDVRHEQAQADVGISLDRLTSSDVDEHERYMACWDLAHATWAWGSTGIAYPSAAANWADAWNLALFGDPSTETWHPLNVSEIDPPQLAVDEVRVLA